MTKPGRDYTDSDFIQSHIFLLSRLLQQEKLSVLILLEGLEGSAKPDILHQLVRVIDPRIFSVHYHPKAHRPIKDYPWLYPYWQNVPPWGRIHLYYRSYYQVVLRDLVFSKNKNKQRTAQRLADAVAFEQTLYEGGITLIKIWMEVDPKIQMKRLKAPHYTEEIKHGLKQNKKHAAYTKQFQRIQSKLTVPNTQWHTLNGNQPAKSRKRAMELVARAIEHRLSSRLVHELREELLRGRTEGRYDPQMVDYITNNFCKIQGA